MKKCLGILCWSCWLCSGFVFQARSEQRQGEQSVMNKEAQQEARGKNAG